MFCGKCGKQIDDSARFCRFCGAKVVVPDEQAGYAQAVPVQAAPVQEAASTAIPTPAPAPAAPVRESFSPDSLVPAGKYIRYKCSCGNVSDTYPGTPCKKCGSQQSDGYGYYKIYRMGNMMGMTAPFSIYIDGEGYGRIGNKQTCWIRLPYGTHSVHIAAGMNRRCTDMQFELSPSHPLECAKVHMKVGAFSNTFVIESALNEDVPD